MMNLSKTKYVSGCECEKKLWLSFYKPEIEVEIDENLAENGKLVGEYARSLFGTDYILIERKDNNQMVEDTKKYINNKPNIICEASFNYLNNFCSVDILKNDIDGVEIYEVKSSTSVKPSYIDDISYQTWVLKKSGLNVKKSYIVYINNTYVKNGELDLNQLFNIEDVTSLLNLSEVEDRVNNLNKVINSNSEPNVSLNTNCNGCPYFDYCTKELIKPNVFDVGWSVPFKKKVELFHNGKVSFSDVANLFGDKANLQIDCYLNNTSVINKKEINDFLNTLTYPLYFLDFEAYQTPIPTIDGTKPFQQICFQYSLHYYLEDGGELYHKEYLCDNYDGNSMEGLCEQLCKDVPLKSCVLVYNSAFEKPALKNMAEFFPQYANHLLAISDNVVDLAIPFKNQYYYVKEIGGRYSIKSVLPALFPDDPECDYHNLDQVHHGMEAVSAYMSLKNLDKNEELELRKNLLKYCELDTLAMVKIYDKLKEIK